MASGAGAHAGAASRPAACRHRHRQRRALRRDRVRQDRRPGAPTRSGRCCSVPADATPYPLLMNGAVVDEMLELDPDAVVVKGDLTDSGRPEEYEAFLDLLRTGWASACTTCAATTTRCAIPQLARQDAPYAVTLDGVTLAVLDTTVPGRIGGALPTAQVAMARRGRRRRPTDPCWCSRTIPRGTPTSTTHSCRPTHDALRAVVARRDNVVGYLAGHTHTNRVLRDDATRGVPFVEVACAQGLSRRVGRVPRVRGRLHAGDAPGGGTRGPCLVGAGSHHDPGLVPRPRARHRRRPLLHPAFLITRDTTTLPSSHLFLGVNGATEGG